MSYIPAMTKSATRIRLKLSTVQLIFAVALVARLLVFAAVAPWSMSVTEQVNLNNDSPGYHDLARTLLEHGRFARGVDREPDALRTPGYPLFVAAVYGVCGERPWAAMLVQLVLDALACALFLVTLQRVMSDDAARWAAWFYALDPHLLLYGCLLLSDSLFVLALIVMFWLAVRAMERDFRWSDLALVGVTVGVATMVRPVAQYLPVFLCGWLLWTLRRTWKRAVASALVLGVAFGLTILPWLLRNEAQFGRMALSTSGDYNLLALNVAPVEAAKRGQDFDLTERQLRAEADTLAARDGRDPARMNDFERAEYWKRLATQYLRAEPGAIAVAYAKGIVFTFLNLGTSDLVNSLGYPATSLRDVHGMGNKIVAFVMMKSAVEISVAAVIALFLLASYALMLRGCACVRQFTQPGAVLFLLAMIVYFALIVGVGGLARFRLPIVPFYLPFVGLGAARWWRRRRGAATA
jgi:4-amino-4-deoxy-L-arabinose transferase-like glycosyltransferase